jgi:hypothetical protein
MAVSDSREVVIEATREEILDVIADVEATPEWSSQQQAVEIVESGEGDKTKVKFELTVDPSVPLPGFILKRAIKGAMETATDGPRKQVLKVKKDGK